MEQEFCDLTNHQNMNCSQFKDLVFQTCLDGAVVASWSLTQEVASSNPFAVMINIFVADFSENT